MNELRILAIGDFHGKLPNKLFNLAKSDKIDVIVTQGDFSGNAELSRLFFKYVYGMEISLSEAIGKKKADALEKRNFQSGVGVIKKLDSIGKPVIAITGNWDYSKWHDVGSRYKYLDEERKYINRFYSFLSKTKNIFIVDFNHKHISGINFVGYPRSSYPGMITKKKIKNDKKLLKKINLTKKDNKSFYTRLRNLFNKNTVFISHNVPFKTKLDVIKRKIEKGKHYGSYLARKVILDLKPMLTICGHMHENQGIIKLGNTPVVNVGAANEGEGALITLDVEKKKVKSIKLIR
jgi:Icc-related predicted phosphoesterase